MNKFKNPLLILSFLLATIWLKALANDNPSSSKESSSAGDQTSAIISQYKRIIFLGDSLTEGFGVPPDASYPSLIEKQLSDLGYSDIQVINAGISGATTAGAARRLNWHLRAHAGKTLLVIALGANDGLRGLELSASRKNLEETITRAKKSGMSVVLAGMKIPPNYGEDYAKEFESLYPLLAEKHGVTLIPFLLEGVAAEPDYNLADGIHPNEQGYEKIASHVLSFIKPLLDKP